MTRYYRLGLLSLAVAFACGDSDQNDDDDTSGPTASSDGTTAAMTSAPSGPTSDSGEETTTSADGSDDTTADDDTTDGTDESTGGPADEPAIQWIGRFDASDPAGTRFSWSGSGFVVRFDGTGLGVRMDDAGRYFTLLVDGIAQPNLATRPGEQDYVLAADLLPGEHIVELYRRTEGSFGVTSVLSVDIDGELLAPPPVSRRIEIVGDSITCGYGNEGVAPCNFSAETENHYLTYGAVAARTLGAQLSTVAWSGKGVIYNYGTDVNEPLPELYDRALATEQVGWDYAWQPDVVAINLGTNDFSTGGDPTAEVFVGAYVDFTTHIRVANPDAYILLLAPSLFGTEATMVEGYLQQVVDARIAAGDPAIGWADVNVRWQGAGCDGHPSIPTHAAMGARLTEEIQTRLGW